MNVLLLINNLSKIVEPRWETPWQKGASAQPNTEMAVTVLGKFG